MSVLEHLSTSLADRYAIIREIGAGGMATVYLADDLKHHRKVAVKVLKPELAAMLGSKRFVTEVAVTARLQHPHLLPLFDSGEMDGLLFYVMPYVEGESLRARLDREGVLPIDDALAIAGSVALALDYAHTQGVVHRDIKPENILLGVGGPVLADFGIALAISEAGGERLTQTGISIGTPQYMSPEQATGGPKIDPRSDIYSLAAVTYEMLTGEAPHTGRTAQQIIARLLTEKPRSLRSQRPSVPPSVEVAVVRGLEKLPADRWTTAADFAAALVGKSKGRLFATLVPVLSSRRSRVGLAAAALSVALGVAGWLGRGRLFQPPVLDSLAVLPFENISGDSTQDAFVAVMHESIIGQLGSISGLNVISRTSTLRYRNSKATAQEIARELNVKALVEGGVARSGDSVHIQVRLIRMMPREQIIWKETFDKPVRLILLLQGDIASEIARTVHVALSPAERARLRFAPFVNPEAYNLYLKEAALTQGGLAPANADSAMTLLHLSLAMDSGLAMTHIKIGGIWYARAMWGEVAPREAYERALPHIRRAMLLDSTSADLHATMAIIDRTAHDWKGVERDFRAAIDLRPSDAVLHGDYARFLAGQRRAPEALREIERAMTLDPLSAASHFAYGAVCNYTDRPREAIGHLQRALQLGAKQPAVHWQLWQAYHTLGLLDSALAEAAARATAGGRPDIATVMQRAYGDGGYQVAMRRAADQLARESSTRRVKQYWIASLYEHAGDTERAIDWFERAVAADEADVYLFPAIPASTSLRTHPRWRALMKLIDVE